MFGLPVAGSIGSGFRKALTWPSQTDSVFAGVKSERKILSDTVACTEGTAAEANSRVCSRMIPRIASRAFVRSCGVCGHTSWPLPALVMLSSGWPGLHWPVLGSKGAP